MSIQLFARENFRGDSQVIRSDCDTLRGTRVGNNPSSLKMTSDGDAVLLCKKKNWNGAVFYLRGKEDIADLGDTSDGGKQGFGNSVTSVRVTDFTVKLNVTVVTGDDGTLPGNWTTRSQVKSDINQMISMTNNFFKDEKALLNVKLSDITFRADEKRFRMNEKEWGSIPGSWKKAHLIDVVFPDSLEGAVGVGSFPWHGKFCLVSASRSTVDQMARTLAHELGHYWGLTHDSGGGKAANIMTQSKNGKHINDSRLRDSQIEEIQQKLARNLTRQGDRFE